MRLVRAARAVSYRTLKSVLYGQVACVRKGTPTLATTVNLLVITLSFYFVIVVIFYFGVFLLYYLWWGRGGSKGHKEYSEFDTKHYTREAKFRCILAYWEALGHFSDCAAQSVLVIVQ